MNSMKLKNFMEVLLQRYPHIVGEEHAENTSSEKMVESIISYYEDIISCMPGNVYWLDKNCVSLGCNQNVLDMFGFKSLNEFKGLTFEGMAKAGRWTNEAMTSFKNDTLEVIKTGKPKLNIEELPIPHPDGRMIHFLSSRVPLFDQKYNVIGVVGISIDISELKQTQAALKQAKEHAEAASHAKSEFVANMSHDVKTPLSAIIGMAELLTYRLQDEDLEFAQSLLMSSRQLLSFFDNCLEAFKLESRDVLTTEPFHLKTMLDEIYSLFLPSIKLKNLQFEINIDEQIPPYLIGSHAGFYRIILNLVGNAVKFTHQGSIIININVDDASKNDHNILLKLSVEDTGIGIPEDKQKVIFDRFTRLIPSYKGTYEGSGIGLYIVHKFVKLMHGEIVVKSEIGKGCQFIVQLPFQIPINDAPKHTKQQSLFPTTPPAKKCATGVRVLLVEDNLTAQWIESSLLSSMNCHVEVVASGEEALEIFKPGKFDLVFMDIGLPGIQGDAVSKLIRKMEQGSSFHVPIVALTAHITEDIEKHLTAGIETVLSKPLSREQAGQIIEHYLECK